MDEDKKRYIAYIYIHDVTAVVCVLLSGLKTHKGSGPEFTPDLISLKGLEASKHEEESQSVSSVEGISFFDHTECCNECVCVCVCVCVCLCVSVCVREDIKVLICRA